MREFFHSEDREILRVLYAEQEWKEIYFFHEKYLLSPAQLSRTVRKLEELGIIESSGHMIKMTDFGRSWLLANRHEVFYKFGDMRWKKFYSGLPSVRARADEYVPRPSKMKKGFFRRCGGDRQS